MSILTQSVHSIPSDFKIYLQNKQKIAKSIKKAVRLKLTAQALQLLYCMFDYTYGLLFIALRQFFRC